MKNKLIKLTFALWALLMSYSLYAVGWSSSNPDTFEIFGNLSVEGYVGYGPSFTSLIETGSYTTDLLNNHDTSLRLRFVCDNDGSPGNIVLGAIHGSTTNRQFGLLDADQQWSIRTMTDQYIDFFVDYNLEMRVADGYTTFYGRIKFIPYYFEMFPASTTTIRVQTGSTDEAVLQLTDSDQTYHISLYGKDNGNQVGLVDKNGKWFVRGMPNDETQLLVNGNVVLRANSNGTVSVTNAGGDLSMGTFTQQP